MCVCVCVCVCVRACVRACVCVCVSHVLDSQLLNGWTYGHENCRVCSRTRSHDSVIFSYFFG